MVIHIFRVFRDVDANKIEKNGKKIILSFHEVREDWSHVCILYIPPRAKVFLMFRRKRNKNKQIKDTQVKYLRLSCDLQQSEN